MQTGFTENLLQRMWFEASYEKSKLIDTVMAIAFVEIVAEVYHPILDSISNLQGII